MTSTHTIRTDTTTGPTTSPTDTLADISLSALHHPTHTLVRLRGDLDIAAAPALRQRLLVLLLLHPGMKVLMLDLSAVSFCDASGLAVLIGTHRRATQLGITLHLAAPHPHITKLIHLTGLDRNLTIHPTLPDALAA
jgi:anti-anti-sigma factor